MTLFKGSIVALITPMTETGAIDQESFKELIEWHIASKTDGIVIAGTTGESATLDADEQFELISLAVDQAAKRIPIIAGTGTNSTKTTIKLTENAKRAKADACLVVTPYYNKPTQNGLFSHYQAIADAVDLPMILYNVPGRTACDLLPETIARLAEHPHIIGVKEATGKIERAQTIKKLIPNHFAIYSGDDLTALSLLQYAKADGVISVTANLAPVKMHALCSAIFSNDYAMATKINQTLTLLHERLFLESNPIPVKWALHHMKKIKSGIRLPLVSLDNKYHETVKEAMQHAGVI
ncbi:MAG: 4-hydroxy-tetrahydrodipicolinate synthase [Gammaproteobacteria bacterium RIFCSPHIGHO2_12_FULL_38_14]|nr:MAG: 4-hydroxy-tetrahydrodipicolinate synthase [Gammaproteobacteria bacterium RIFCSPHIGHO2_12_FULL_38_14]